MVLCDAAGTHLQLQAMGSLLWKDKAGKYVQQGAMGVKQCVGYRYIHKALFRDMFHLSLGEDAVHMPFQS